MVTIRHEEVRRLEYELALTQRVLASALMALDRMSVVLGRAATASNDAGALTEMVKVNKFLNEALADINRLRDISRKREYGE